MKNRYLIMTLLAALFFTASCSKDETDPDSLKPRHTLIMYVLADSNLAGHLNTNIYDVLAAAPASLPANGRIYIYYDGSQETTLYEVVVKGGKAEKAVRKSYEPRYSLDPSNMAEVMSDIVAVNNGYRNDVAAGETYGIVFSSHATGWFPPQLNDISRPQSPGLGGGAVGGAAPEYDFSKPDDALTRGFGQDGRGGQTMSIPDLVEGIRPIHFDYILFDACFMSSIEVLHEMRHSAEYIIASPSEVLSKGFPYQKAVPILFNNNRELPDKLVSLGQAYVDYYAQEKIYKSAAISVVRMSELDNMALIVKDIFAKNPQEIDPRDVQPLERLSAHAFFDLQDYLAARSISRPADSYAVAEALEKALLYEGHTGQLYSAYGGFFDATRVCGISTYVPRSQFPVTRAAWLQTSWAKAVQAK